MFMRINRLRIGCALKLYGFDTLGVHFEEWGDCKSQNRAAGLQVPQSGGPAERIAPDRLLRK